MLLELHRSADAIMPTIIVRSLITYPLGSSLRFHLKKILPCDTTEPTAFGTDPTLTPRADGGCGKSCRSAYSEESRS
jgi:hypothetical protein